MARLARIIVPDLPHHITQRGNNRQDVFFTDEDRDLYLRLLREYAEKEGVDILGYCLMTNHVHLLVIPHSEEALAKALGRLHWRHARAINRLHGRTGHLWQNRFFSCALEDGRALEALAYLECNPVRAHMVSRAGDYRWSSAKAHLGIDAPPAWLDMRWWDKRTDPSRWAVRLRGGRKLDGTDLVSHTRRGRPLGRDRFLAKLEARLGHRLRPMPVGRPRKENK